MDDKHLSFYERLFEIIMVVLLVLSVLAGALK